MLFSAYPTPVVPPQRQILCCAQLAPLHYGAKLVYHAGPAGPSEIASSEMPGFSFNDWYGRGLPKARHRAWIALVS